MELTNLHQTIADLHQQMMPYVSDMARMSQAIAAIGALLYISYRILKHLAQSSPIEVFPLLRPFAIGICITLFPTLILGGIQGILSGVLHATNTLVEDQVTELRALSQQQQQLERELLMQSAEKDYLISNTAFDQKIQELGLSAKDLLVFTQIHLEKQMYQAKQSLVDQFIEVLALFFNAASLCVDIIRTFILIVLSILGPLCFALSIFDGLQNSLNQWFARYISVYLWLPIADIFSAILAKTQTLIVQNQLQVLLDPTTQQFSYNAINAVFMLIAIVGYLTIPTVASWVVQAVGTSNFTRNIYMSSIKTATVLQHLTPKVSKTSAK